ncbi:Uncharacterised protein [Streptococcus dysgalactiae subsp. equisimilis]|nr:Uncharacterised protein [Streptococcus dysgalactiae subsp. equisimilis]
MAGIERRVELDDTGDLQARRVLLEEQFAADAIGAADQRHRALAQVAQEQVGVARMELGEFQLAGLDRWIDQPPRMADAYPGGGRPRGAARAPGLARAARRRRAGRTFAGHLARRFVFAQTVEHRLADDPATGHLRIGNLAQSLRSHPLHHAGLARRRHLRQRAGIDRQGRQALMDLLQAGGGEAGADLAGVAQPAFLVRAVEAEKQGADVPARALRLGVADDHELLAQLALELDPVVAAARAVDAAQALADHAFEAEPASVGQQVAGVFRERRGEPQGGFVLPLQQRLQARAALFQGDIAQVLAFVIRQVEKEIQDVLAVALLEGVLQGLEVRPALLVEDHQLAVQPTALKAEPGQGLLQVRQAFAPVVAVAGQQAHVAVLDAAHQPVAVQLELVGPLPLRRLLDQAGQFGGDPLGHRRLPAALAGFASFAASRGPGRGRGGFAAAGHQRALAEHAVGTFLQHVEAIQAARLVVLGLDQEPLGLLAAQVGADEVPAPGEFLAVEEEAEMTFLQPFARVV